MQAKFHLKREQTNRLEYGRGKDPNVGVHFHSQIEIYLILRGKVEVLVSDKRRVLGRGELAVSFSYDAHGYRTIEDAETLYLIVPTDLCGEFLPLLSERHAGSPFISDAETYETVRAALERILSGQSELTTRGYIYVILGTILERLPIEPRSDAQTPRFSAELLIYISEHFREELTLATMAAAFGYHPSYLSRSFRQTFGISFARYLSMVRLREAILLLRAGGKSVTACAMESGFGSLRSFYRAFYKEFGCTPREYLARTEPS